jgi:uroporphyrinogen decarboxylase
MSDASNRLTGRAPNFDNLRTVLLNGTPEYLPIYELFADREIMEAVLGKPFPDLRSGVFRSHTPISREEIVRFQDLTIEFYYKTGYDYVPAGPGLQLKRESHQTSEPGRKISGQKRIWQNERGGFIQSWADFEAYSWPTISDVDFAGIEYVASKLPDGMKIISGFSGIYENVSFIPGVETLCYMVYDEPELVNALFEKIGSLFAAMFEALVEIDAVGAVLLADDLGHYGGTFLPPAILREHMLPWYRKIADAARRKGKPFVLHCCGNMKGFMDELIDTGINAKHSFEDKIEPVWEAKELYGDRIALLGGVDVNILCSYSEEDTRRHVRSVIERCAGKGFALGSGNSVTDYMKVDNYLAMIDEARRYNKA